MIQGQGEGRANLKRAARTSRGVPSMWLLVGCQLLSACGGTYGAGAQPVPAGVPGASATNAPVTVSNPSGPCLVIDGARDRVVENMMIGPCAGAGIEIRNSTNVSVRGVTIADVAGNGVTIEGSHEIDISESSIARASTGVYALDSSGIRTSCNTIIDPQGPRPRGQAVQFDKVRGGKNAIRCNIAENRPGLSQPEDTISLYQSTGTAELPIRVAHNLLIGGGPSASGGGVMLGDSGGSHQAAEGNTLVDPGQYGLAVSGGDHMTIADNLVFARVQPFTNVGVYVWNQSAAACQAIAVRDNRVNWQSQSGAPNGFFNAGNCGDIAGLGSNAFSATIGAEIRDLAPPEACACERQGRRP